jgi:hypothetical protein
VRASALDAEIDQLRRELTELVGELDRRRHELLDVKGQVRRHAWPLGLVALAIGAAAAGAVVLRRRRARRRSAPALGGRGLRRAVGRIMSPREPVAVEPGVLERIGGAAGSAAAVYLVKHGLDRLLVHPGRAERRV